MRLPPGNATGFVARSSDQRLPRLHAAINARRAARAALDRIRCVRFSGNLFLLLFSVYIQNGN